MEPAMATSTRILDGKPNGSAFLALKEIVVCLVMTAPYLVADHNWLTDGMCGFGQR